MKELIMLIINLFSFMNLKNKTGTNIENKPISLTKKSLTQGETSNLLNIDDYNIVHYNILNEEISYENFDENNYVKRSRTVRTMGTLEDLKLSGNNIIINKIVDDDNNEILYSEGYNPNNENKDNEIDLLSEGGIYGEDDRTLIENSNAFPYFATGLIRYLYKNENDDLKETNCTGFLQGPNVLVTSAHNVFGDFKDDNIGNSTFVNDIYFYPGRNKNYTPYTVKGVSISIPREYYEEEDLNYDWAVIELEYDVGNYTGWYGKIGNWYEYNSDVYSYGYPINKNNQMYYAPGKLKGKTNYIYKTTIDFTEGQSGSPLFMTGSDGNTYVCGIMSYDFGIGNIEFHIAATKFNTFVFHYLNSYVASNIQWPTC